MAPRQETIHIPPIRQSFLLIQPTCHPIHIGLSNKEDLLITKNKSNPRSDVCVYWVNRHCQQEMLSKLRFLQLSATFASPQKKAAFPQTFSFTAKFRPRMGSASYATSSGSSSRLLFRQLFEKESSTYTYLLADASHPDKPALVHLLCLEIQILCSRCLFFCLAFGQLNCYIVSRVTGWVNWIGFLSFEEGLLWLNCVYSLSDLSLKQLWNFNLLGESLFGTKRGMVLIPFVCVNMLRNIFSTSRLYFFCLIFLSFSFSLPLTPEDKVVYSYKKMRYFSFQFRGIQGSWTKTLIIHA